VYVRAAAGGAGVGAAVGTGVGSAVGVGLGVGESVGLGVADGVGRGVDVGRGVAEALVLDDGVASTATSAGVLMAPATAAAPIPTARMPTPAASTDSGRAAVERPAIPRHAGWGARRRRVETKPAPADECPGWFVPLRATNARYRSHRSCAGVRQSCAWVGRSSDDGGISA